MENYESLLYLTEISRQIVTRTDELTVSKKPEQMQLLKSKKDIVGGYLKIYSLLNQEEKEIIKNEFGRPIKNWWQFKWSKSVFYRKKKAVAEKVLSELVLLNLIKFN